MSTTYTISSSETDTIWTQSGSVWVSSTSAVSGALIGAFTVAVGGGHDDTIWDDYVGAGEIATGVIDDDLFYANSGGVVSGASVLSGGVLVVESGGVGSGISVAYGGYVEGFAGAALDNVTVASGAYLEVHQGATVSGDVVISGGIFLLDITTNYGVWTSQGGANVIDGVTVSSGAGIILVVSSGGAVTDFSAGSGGIDVYSGGQALSASLGPNDFGTVFGTASATKVGAGAIFTIESGGFAASSIVNSGGDLTVASGGAATGVSVGFDAVAYLSSGGSLISATATTSGTIELQAGAVGQDDSVASGGIFMIDVDDSYGTWRPIAGPTVFQGVAISSGALIEASVESGGSIAGFVLNGGYFKVNYAGQSFGATINSGLEIVSGGAFASGTVINSGGNLDVFGSASETNATIGLGGFEYVAGTASDDLIAGGRLEVASGGVYSGTVSFGGPHGTLQIDQQAAFTGVVSGFAIGDLVEFAGVGYTSGDFATVSSTGSGNSLVTVETASRQAIETFSVKGAYPADDFVASAAANGSLEVQLYSPTITYTIACNKTDTLWTLSGSTWVSATSAVSGPLIGAFNEAIAVGRDDTIFDDFVGANQIATGVVQSGAFIVNAGGEASATVVASGGVLEVQAGGSAYGAKVSAGGALQLYSGFIADQMTISAATYVEVGNGARYAGFTACNNSEWIVESGGLVTGMTVVGSAGVVDAYANGGEFLNAAIELGGSLDNCGGLLSGGSIVDDGFALVYNSGSDAGTLIAYGGDLKVASGGHASADQLGAGGLIEIASGGVYSASLAFSGPNALLQIDQGGQFNGVISGFGADDAILFSGLQYASGDSATFGSNGSGGGTVSIANASHHQIASFTVSGLYSADEFVVAAAADDALEVSLSSSAAQYTIAYGEQETIWTLNGSTWTSSTTVTSGPVIGPYVSAVGSGKDDTIFDDYVGAGDIATGVVKGGQFLIESGGEALSAIVQSGGNLVVSGGYAASTTISGGMEIVEAGGSVVSTTVSCSQASGVYAISQQLIMSGGSASRSSAGANGDIFVYAGGALSSSFASNGGMVAVEAGGQLSSANIQSGGILELYQATTVKSVVVSRGATFEPFLTSNYGSWTQISGSATVLGATLASGVTIDLCVCSGGAISNYVAEGGYQTVYAGGAATSAVVALGANLEVWGTVTATTVASGSLTILAGATDIGAIVEQGGFATDAGSDSGDSIVGGTLEIASGGLYSGALGFTGSGGLLEIDSQGGFGGMVSGFTADDVIEFAGLVYSAGDVAAFSPTGSSGGEVTIYNAADQQIASLAVSGKYSSSSFVASGGAGGRLVLGLSASQASVISYNQFNTIWTSKGTKWSSATSATAGPVIGPFAFAVGSGHDDLIWENDVGSGQIATGLVSGGVFDINSGGEVSAVTIAANGVVSDYEGSLVDALVEAGGSAYIDFGAPFNAGGGAFSVAVASGGSLFVDASTTVSGVVVSSGGSLIIAINQNASAASLPGAQVQAGGNCLFEINSGITLSGATIVAGQSLTTEGGGVGQSLVVDGGSLDVNSAARSLATYIEAGGAEIFAGGSASGDLIAAGADELVLGGAADDVISGGRLEIGSGGTLSGSLTFAGSGGLLALDSGATFAATVSGFVVGDEVEFKSLAYASGDQAIFKAAGSSGGSILIETAGGARLASFAINNGYAIGDDYCVTSAGGGTAVAVNSAGPVVTVAVYTANEAALDEYLQGFAIRDTAANVSPEFASFCADAHLNAITVADNGVIAGVTISELSSDAPRFRMISDANGLPYQLGLGDTANNVASALTTEVADIAHIASIALTDVGAPQLDVTAAQADDDVALFEKIVNPLFDVMGAGLAPIWYAGGNGEAASPIALTASGLEVYVKANSSVAVTGGGDTISAVNDDSLSLAGSAGSSSQVTASDDAITLAASAASITGGGNKIALSGASTVSLFGSNNNWDGVTGSGATVIVNASQTGVVGGGDTIWSNGASSISLYGTNGSWDTVYGSGGTFTLNSAQVAINGGGDTIWNTGASSISLYNTSGVSDILHGSGMTVTVNAASASVAGGGNTIWSNGASTVGLSATGGAWDCVEGSNQTVTITNGQAGIVGGGDTIVLAGSSTVSLGSTGTLADSVQGSLQTVILNSAQAAIAGGGDTVWLLGSSGVSLSGTNGAWDGVYGSGGSITLNSAQAGVSGGGDTISLNGGSSVALVQTNNNWDAVNGSGETVILGNAQAGTRWRRRYDLVVRRLLGEPEFDQRRLGRRLRFGPDDFPQ